VNEYEAKQEAKRDRLSQAAERATERSNRASERAHSATAGIPMGQPILVGHHSEGRHRNALKRSDRAMRKAIDEGERAKELRARAAAVGSGGISSDDPDAIEKLREKVAKLEDQRARMKEINAAFRKGGRDCAALAEIEFRFKIPERSMAGLRSALEEHVARGISRPFKPFESWAITNVGASIRATRKRIAELEARAPADTPNEIIREGDGWKVEKRYDLNRLVFDFDAKPTRDVCRLLKSHGFKWFRSEGVWSRSLSNGSEWQAEDVARHLPEGDGWRA